MFRQRWIASVSMLLMTGLLLPGAVAPARAETIGPHVITKSTELSSDVDGGFVIAADGIVFDGHGFTVHDNGSTCHGVQIQGHSFVTVRNVHVEGFHCGAGFLLEALNAQPATHNTIVSNVARDNAVGFALGGASHNSLVANQAIDNNGNNFQIAGGSNANDFRDNVAIGGSQFGFILAESSGNTFRANTARAVGTNGFHTDRSPKTTFIGNRAIETGVGFMVHNSPGSKLIDNVIIRSSDVGIRIINGTDDTLVAGNRLSGTHWAGIVLTASANVTIRNNAVSGGSIGILVEQAATSSTISGNRIWSTREAALALQDNSTGSRITGNRSCATEGVDYRENDSAPTRLSGNHFCSIRRDEMDLPATDTEPVVPTVVAESAPLPVLWSRLAPR